MLVGCAGLSLDTVLGVVCIYLSRLECSEVVGSNDLDLDSVSLAVQVDDLKAFKVYILGSFLVRLGEHTLGACILSLHINDSTYPSNDFGLTGPTTLSQLSSSPGLYRLASDSSCWFISSVVDYFQSLVSDCSLPISNSLYFLRGFHSAIPYLRSLARTQIRHGLCLNTVRMLRTVTFVFFHRGLVPCTA